MDTGQGRMEPLSQDDRDLLRDDGHGIPVFEVGEVVELKGSKFTVHTIQREGLVLKLVESRTIRKLVTAFKERHHL